MEPTKQIGHECLSRASSLAVASEPPGSIARGISRFHRSKRVIRIAGKINGYSHEICGSDHRSIDDDGQR